MLVELARGPLETLYGTWDHRVFWDGSSEAISMVYRDPRSGEPTLARVHSSCVTGNVFLSVECDCLDQLRIAMREICRVGSGVIVWLDQEGRGNGKAAHIASQELKKGPRRLSQSEAYRELGFPVDARSYRSAAEIFKVLGIASLLLLTDNDLKVAELRRLGLRVIKFSMDELIPSRNAAVGSRPDLTGDPLTVSAAPAEGR